MAISGVAVAAEIDVRIAAAGVKHFEKATLTAIRLPPAEEFPTIRRVVVAPGTEVLQLDPGTWTLHLETAGYWHEDKHVVVTTNRRQGVLISLLPAGTIEGGLRSDNEDVPKWVIVAFRSIDSATPFSGSVRCPVAEARWRCQVPAGVLDLETRVRGFLPAFHFDSAVPRGGIRNFGTWKLIAGASVSGVIGLADDGREGLGGAKVTLSPLTAASDEKATIASGMTNHRGFFHIAGIPPGEYLLRARRGDLASLDVPVNVIARREALLREPVRLSKPRDLFVNVTPPLDPWTERWRVALTRDELLVASGTADGEGRWRAPRLPVGVYQMTIDTHRSDRWVTREIDFSESSSTNVDASAQASTVEGSLRLGKRPLEAKLTFVEKEGSATINVMSSGDGDFKSFFPAHAGRSWSVTVDASSQGVVRKLDITLRDRADSLFAEIVLPETYLSGRVLREDGRRADFALVNVWSNDEPLTQLTADMKGEWSLAGAAAGSLRIQAMADLEESEPVEVVVREDLALQDIVLQLQANRQVRGRVVSASGPIAGAMITIYPTDRSWSFVVPTMSDSSGRFLNLVPSGTREADITVAAPGFAFHAAHLHLTPDPLLLKVDQLGGTLVLDISAEAITDAILLHNGALVRASSLLREWGGKADRKGDATVRMTFRGLESGSYSLCTLRTSEHRDFRAGTLRSGTRCVNGFLPMLGDLHLSK